MKQNVTNNTKLSIKNFKKLNYYQHSRYIFMDCWEENDNYIVNFLDKIRKNKGVIKLKRDRNLEKKYDFWVLFDNKFTEKSVSSDDINSPTNFLKTFDKIIS